jgi:molybdopterin-guanine dinucleotide biosynthesis protein A/molybdopterin converting factor small subunit
MRTMDERSSVNAAAAVVLAGGRSSRMGRPKGLLPFDGIPLIVHIVERLKQEFGEVVVVAAPGQELPSMDVTLVRDDVAYQGPVGGIAYGLRASTREVNFVTSCDSAFLNMSLAAHVVAAIAGHDVAVPRWEGRFQPLHAAYRRSVLPLLEQQLERGELRPVYLFDKVPTRRIEADEVRPLDPGGWSFFNMNTPEDYAAALERWSRHDRGGARQDDRIPCTVELFGAARMVAQQPEVPLVLRPGATVADVLAALADSLPVLVGPVLRRDDSRLVDGYVCNVNGLDFVRRADAAINPGDRILILSADAGG